MSKSQQFQAWQQVAATGGEFEGKAGVVQSQEDDVVTVKFDEHEEPQLVAADDLKHLG